MRSAIFALLLALPGCFGLALDIHGTEVRDIASPQSERRGRIFIRDDLPPMSSERLGRLWGKPDEIVETAEGAETWTYDFDLQFNGAFVLILIVPLPLFVPVGYENVEFLVADGVVESARTTRSSPKFGAFCGWFSSHPGGTMSFGCGKRTFEPTDREAVDFHFHE